LRARSQLKGQIERIEREIEGFDSRVSEIELLFESPDIYTDAALSLALSEELAELNSKNSRPRNDIWVQPLLQSLGGLKQTAIDNIRRAGYIGCRLRGEVKG